MTKIVYCIDNNNFNLTIGKGYEIRGTESTNNNSFIFVVGDDGKGIWVSSKRFVDKSELRDKKISKLLK